MEQKLKDAYCRIARCALEEIKDHKGIPIDESQTVSCDSFTELFSQYNKGRLSRKESDNILLQIIDLEVTPNSNKTLREELSVFLNLEQIFGIKNTRKRKP